MLGVQDHPSQTNPSRPPKRARTSLACATCRKHKVRCDLVQDDGSSETRILACHRCRTLSLECSLTASDAAAIRVIRHNAALNSHSEATKSGFWPLGPPLAEDGSPKSFSESDTRFRILSFLSPAFDPDLHWSAPILAMQVFLKRVNPPRDPISRTSDHGLDQILTEPQVKDLTQVFVTHYNPWLGFEPSPQGRHELLDAVRCCIASRHLPPIARKSVAPRLHALVQNLVAMHSLEPDIDARTAHEVVQALTILGTWSPVREHAQGGLADSRLAFSTAVGLAMDLRINQLSGVSQTPHSPQNRNKAALWISLSVMDSLACIGKGRLPTSRRSKADTTLFQNVQPWSTPRVREARLAILARILDLTEQGLSIKFDEENGGEVTVHNNVLRANGELDGVLNQLDSTNATLDCEAAHWSMLKIQCWIGIALITYHGFFEVSYASKTRNPLDEYVSDKRSFLGVYVSKSLDFCHDFVAIILDCPRKVLGTSPDSIFPQILFFGVLCVALDNVLRFDRLGHTISKRFPTRHLAEVAAKLTECAPSPDHPAAKCGSLLAIIVSHWEAYLNETISSGQKQELLGFSIPMLKEYFPMHDQTDDHLLQFLPSPSSERSSLASPIPPYLDVQDLTSSSAPVPMELMSSTIPVVPSSASMSTIAPRPPNRLPRAELPRYEQPYARPHPPEQPFEVVNSINRCNNWPWY